VAKIDAEGGQVTSADGRVKLVFPPGAVDGEIQVSMTVRDASPQDGNVLSPVIEIETEPALEAPLDVAAMLSLADLPDGVSALQFARHMSVPGELRTVDDGESVDALTYWRPLMLTRPDEEGAPLVPLVHFSAYAPISMTMPHGYVKATSYSSSHGTAPVTSTLSFPTCVPSDEAMTPPPAPEGYVYVGTDVVIDHVYQDQLSSVPLTRPGSPQDMVYIDSETTVDDGTTQCDVIVAHVFTPLAPETEGAGRPCDPSTLNLEPPDAPVGYTYVGRNVMVGNEVDSDLTTVPLGREPKPTDLVLIQSDTSVVDKVNECDIVIQHVFEPASTSSDPVSGCTPSDQMLEPPPPPASEGFAYLGRSVMVNNVYRTDLSTAPLGRVQSPQDVVMISSSTMTGGQGTCDIVVNHIFARTDETGDTRDCAPAAEQLEAPAAPEGYVYVGRDVVIDGVWSERDSTVPLERPESPQDIQQICSQTRVKDGETVCDVIVRHLYAPISHSGCPLPDDLYQIPTVPPCHRYVGYVVVVDAHLVQTSVPLDRPLRASDVVHITSYTKGSEGGTACDVIVGHVFEPIPCPPCQVTVGSEIKPWPMEGEHYIELYFSPRANVSDADRLKLYDLSISKPYAGEQGYFAIYVPPGTDVTHEGNQTTIRMPNCE
jgi:hypothetical protein